MHIPEGVLSPTTAIATGAISAAGLAIGLRSLKDRHRDKTVVVMGCLSAFIFAAQMVKFPIGPGVAGHLMGGVLAAILLGPWAAVVVLSAVLFVQCFLFADGGVTALGANVLNMGLIGTLAGSLIYGPLRRAIGGPRGVLIAGPLAAWFSVLLAAAACSAELAISNGGRGFSTILGWMTLVHAGIGFGEALITGLTLQFLLTTRPDLILEEAGETESKPRRTGRLAAAWLAIALAVAVFLGPFAWPSPDGLEYVGARLNILQNEAPPLVQAPMAEYEWPIFGVRSVRVATAAAGLAGTLAVFGVGLALARAFARREAIVDAV